MREAASHFWDTFLNSAFLNCPFGILKVWGFYKLEKYTIVRFELGKRYVFLLQSQRRVIVNERWEEEAHFTRTFF